jgi:hypothetical protein
MWRRSLCPSALIFFVAAALGCSNPKAEDLAACAGYTCTAGTCVSDQGKPTCVCGAAEELAGLSCVLTDGDDTQDTATELQVDGGTVDATLDVRYDQPDQDWYRFDGVTDVWYRVPLNSAEVDDLEVMLASGETLRTDGGTSVYVKAAGDGPLPLVVRSSSGETGAYQVGVQAVASDDFGDDVPQATQLENPDSVAGTLEVPVDVDAFLFTAQRDHFYRLQCAPLGDAGCRLRTADLDLGNDEHEATGAICVRPSGSLLGSAPMAAFVSSLGTAFAYQLSLEDQGTAPSDPANARELPTDAGVVTVPACPYVSYSLFFSPVPQEIYRATASGSPDCRLSDGWFSSSSSAPIDLTVSTEAGTFCSVQLADVGPDDYPNLPGAGPDLVDGTRVLTDFEGEVDSFLLPPDAGDLLRVSADPSGTVLAPWDGGWRFVGPVGYLAPSDQSVGITGDAGSRLVHLESVPDDVPGVVTLQPGETFDGMSEWPRDFDAFDVPMADGARYRITFTSNEPSLLLAWSDGTGYHALLASSYSVYVTGRGVAQRFVVQHATSPTPPDAPTPYTLSISVAQ